MLALEEDLQIQWNLGTWHFAHTTLFKGIINTSVMEANIKVMIRWYMTPARLATIIPQRILYALGDANHWAR